MRSLCHALCHSGPRYTARKTVAGFQVSLWRSCWVSSSAGRQQTECDIATGRDFGRFAKEASEALVLHLSHFPDDDSAVSPKQSVSAAGYAPW